MKVKYIMFNERRNSQNNGQWTCGVEWDFEGTVMVYFQTDHSINAHLLTVHYAVHFNVFWGTYAIFYTPLNVNKHFEKKIIPSIYMSLWKQVLTVTFLNSKIS